MFASTQQIGLSTRVFSASHVVVAETASAPSSPEAIVLSGGGASPARGRQGVSGESSQLVGSLGSVLNSQGTLDLQKP